MSVESEKNSPSIWSVLSKIDCNGHTEKKNGLTYLSWAWAWEILKKNYPNATYSVREWEGFPYLFDANLGYLVETSITINDGSFNSHTLTMRLPVMDYKNRAQKHIEYSTKNGVVAPATMFDINTAIMRCLVKNIALFGLGLYIYAGEDLPSEIADSKLNEIKKLYTKAGGHLENLVKYYKVPENQLTYEQINSRYLVLQQANSNGVKNGTAN